MPQFSCGILPSSQHPLDQIVGHISCVPLVYLWGPYYWDICVFQSSRLMSSAAGNIPCALLDVTVLARPYGVSQNQGCCMKADAR